MKSVICIRTLFLISAFLFSIATCKGQNDPSDLVVGKWIKPGNERPIIFTLSSDLKYQVEFAGDTKIDVWGSYVIEGDQITFNDEGGDYSANEAGVYEFQVSDSSLTFTTVSDAVYGRNILVEGSWSKEVDAEK